MLSGKEYWGCHEEGRLDAAREMIMEITILILEKSWKNHGILFFNFCGNPVMGK